MLKNCMASGPTSRPTEAVVLVTTHVPTGGAREDGSNSTNACRHEAASKVCLWQSLRMFLIIHNNSFKSEEKDQLIRVRNPNLLELHHL